jgi:hypothetical protein
MYDHCAYVRRVEESTSPLNYLLNPAMHERCDKCRVEFGLLAGPQVSHKMDSGLVDVESDLMGRTRTLSKCPTEKYLPTCSKPDTKCVDDSGIPFDCQPCRPELAHLRSCGPAPGRPTFAPPKMPEPLCGGFAPVSEATYGPVQDSGLLLRNYSEYPSKTDPMPYR